MTSFSRVAQRLESVPFLERRDLSLAFVLPGLFVFSAFMLFPVLYLVGISFTNAEPANLFAGEGVMAVLTFGDAAYVGVENYATILADGEFWNSMGVTWLYVGTSVVLKLAFSVALALVLTHDYVRGKRVMRSFVILPMGLPAIFTITVWRGIFSSANYGLANQVLSSVGLPTVSWLTTRWPAFLSYNVTEVWLAYPFMVIITVSALQDVSEDLHEAAKVDGAGFVARFFHVTLPSIKRPLLFATILTSAASFQQFLIPFVFNQGGPAGANQLIVLYGYQEAFAYANYGEGAAISLVAVLFIGAFMWLNVKRGRLADGVRDA